MADDWWGCGINATRDGAADLEVEGGKKVKAMCPCEGGDCGPNAAGANCFGVGGESVLKLLLERGYRARVRKTLA